MTNLRLPFCTIVVVGLCVVNFVCDSLQVVDSFQISSKCCSVRRKQLCLWYDSNFGETENALGKAAPKQQQQQQQQVLEDDQRHDEEPLVRTINGGTNMIFEMARQMMLWDDRVNDISPVEPRTPSAESFVAKPAAKKKKKEDDMSLPRWRPHTTGVSNANPSFRTQTPRMNAQGYASTIWRNVRKRNKPSLWRHALRTFDRMDRVTESGKVVRRYNTHYEGALVACAKLGLWQRALEIFSMVESQAQQPDKQQQITTQQPRKQHHENKQTYSTKKVFVTDDMISSLIRACVRGSRSDSFADTESDDNGKNISERRLPLDAARQVVVNIEESYGFPLVARYLNPLAAAYQGLGLVDDAARLLEDNLMNRMSRPEEEHGEKRLNVHDVGAKDKASYSLLVMGAVSDLNFSEAVGALQNMTDAGLFPGSRELNAWTELSERKSRQRATRSWRKKRDEYWLESVR